MKNEIEQQIFEKMKAEDFGESMCDETKLKVLKWTMKQLHIHNVMVELACPRCGSTNTAPSDKENDAGCYDCGFVWQDN